MATLTQEHRCSDNENFPKPDKLLLATINAFPDTSLSIKKCTQSAVLSDDQSHVLQRCSPVKFSNKNPVKQVRNLSFIQLLLFKNVLILEPELKWLFWLRGWGKRDDITLNSSFYGLFFLMFDVFIRPFSPSSSDVIFCFLLCITILTYYYEL